MLQEFIYRNNRVQRKRSPTELVGLEQIAPLLRHHFERVNNNVRRFCLFRFVFLLRVELRGKF
jgi:hypothetical protein